MCEKERTGSKGHDLPQRLVTAGLVVPAIAALPSPSLIVLGPLGGLDD